MLLGDKSRGFDSGAVGDVSRMNRQLLLELFHLLLGFVEVEVRRV